MMVTERLPLDVDQPVSTDAGFATPALPPAMTSSQQVTRYVLSGTHHAYRSVLLRCCALGQCRSAANHSRARPRLRGRGEAAGCGRGSTGRVRGAEGASSRN